MSNIKASNQPKAGVSDNSSLMSLVMTAFFAAVIFLGIQSFRIPLPAAVGTPFLHFGHIFIMLAILCLSIRNATIAGVLGLVIFDLLNGYVHAIPNVLVNTILNCVVVGIVFSLARKKTGHDRKKEYYAAIGCSVLYGCLNVIVDFVWSTAQLLLLGSGLMAAIIAELSAIPATIINACFTVAGVAILYTPVTFAYRRLTGQAQRAA